MAAAAKEVFRLHCLECHGGAVTRGRIKILDHESLMKRKVIVAGKPEDSTLFQLVTSKDAESRMPPLGQPELKATDIQTIRDWIAAGAPPFPEDVARPAEDKKDPALKNLVGVDYVLKKILEDVRTMPNDRRRFIRYFSLNHLLASGATADELERQRLAFFIAVNHLTWQPEIVKPRAVDPPTNTIYAIDLRDLGWHQQPFQAYYADKDSAKSYLNIFDIALLEYPFGIFYGASDTFDQLVQEYLALAQPVRPVVYVRTDWFVNTVTQPPLYEDFLQLPFSLQELEELLRVDTTANIRDGIAKRAGMTISGVSRNNRVVERNPSPKSVYYWKSFDFKTNKGKENIFLDPVNLYPAGGEFIFGLPNGFQGYFLANGAGRRLDAAITEIVTDHFASDQTVRNGLACIRCHDRGMKPFTDNIRPAVALLGDNAGLDKRTILTLYPEQKVLDGIVQTDKSRFENALTSLLGKLPPAADHPFIKISKRYLDDPIHLSTAAGELGLADPRGLEPIVRLPQFVGLGILGLAEQGVIRRDAWEDYFDLVVRALGLGEPVVNIDGVLRGDFPAIAAPFDVVLKTTRKNNIVEPGDEIAILVVNRSPKNLYIELIGNGAKGEKVILTPASTVLVAGDTYRYPPTGGLKVRGGLGKEQITLFAGDYAFPPGEVLRGKGVTDRVVHPFYTLERQTDRFVLRNNPSRLLKKTIEIETK